MTSRFHKAVTKVENQIEDLQVELKKMEVELHEISKPASLAHKTYMESSPDDRVMAYKVYKRLLNPVCEFHNKMAGVQRKISEQKRLLALKRRQLEDFLERKKDYDAAAERKAAREAEKKTVCLEIGIMKIFAPLATLSAKLHEPF